MKLIKKVKKKLPSLKLMIHYRRINQVSVKKIKFDTDSNTHISLTSYGSRINTVFYTIESLIAQSYPCSSITLYLSKMDIATHTELPNSLQRLIKRGVQVELVDDDIRSYKKLYYSYKKHLEDNNNHARLITVDDDVLYSIDWLKGLIETSRQYPSQIIAHRSHLISLKENGHIKPYRDWSATNNELMNIPNGFRYLPTGVGGVLYPIESLYGLETQKQDFMNLCGFADDIWFKCLTLSNGYLVTPVIDQLRDHKPLSILTLTIKRQGLNVYNVQHNGNDIQMEKAISYFNINFCDFV